MRIHIWSPTNRNERIGAAFILFVVVSLVIIAPAASIWYAKGTQEQITFTVKEKLVKRSGSGSSSSDAYMVFTDHGVLENTDSLWNWKWNSSDVWSGLEVGKTYTATTYGWRVQFLSWYPNILVADVVADETVEALDARIAALKAELEAVEAKRLAHPVLYISCLK